MVTAVVPFAQMSCDNNGFDPQPGAGASQAVVAHIIDSTARTMHAPGFVVGVKTVGGSYVIPWGESNVQTHLAVAAGDRFRVGSITKSMVATVVLQMVEEGRVALDDSIGRWLPGIVAGSSTIRIRHLLNHTSGLPNYTDQQQFEQLLTLDPLRNWTPTELLALVQGKPALFAPGASNKWAYSNTNYIVLGLLVEQVLQRPLAMVLRERIFQPLGMTDTYFATTAETPSPFSRGYFPVNGAPDIDVASLVSPSSAWAAGAVVSSAVDLLRWAEVLANGAIVTAASQSARLTPAPGSGGLAYGFGIEHAGSWVGHDGETFGYQALAFSRAGVGTIVVLSNRSTGTQNEILQLFDNVRWAVFGTK